MANVKSSSGSAGTFVNKLLQAILAGISIGIGGCFFLGIENKVVGALFFTLGLFAICSRGFYLFTGKVGYALENPPSYILDLVIIWVGNLIGTNLVAFLMSLTRVGTAYAEKAAGMCDTKCADNMVSLFVLGIFCNILMYLAVDGFKKNPHEFGKYVGLFLCVAGFILAGFEHCIADMFYFGMAGAWTARSFVCLLAITAGNICGGLIIPAFNKFTK